MHVRRDAPGTLTCYADRDCNELPRLGVAMPGLVAGIAELAASAHCLRSQSTEVAEAPVAITIDSPCFAYRVE